MKDYRKEIYDIFNNFTDEKEIFEEMKNKTVEISHVVSFYDFWSLMVKKHYLPRWTFKASSKVVAVNIYEKIEPYILFRRLQQPEYASHYEWLVKKLKSNKFEFLNFKEFKIMDIIKNANFIFWCTFVISLIFILSPLILRIPPIKHLIDLFFDSLRYSDYKSSFIETLGSLLGTVLAITGTLLLQKKIDQNNEKEQLIKDSNDIRYRITIVYYDLKLAFKDILQICKLPEFSAVSNDRKTIKEFYESTNKLELYIDEGWIRNVASLHEVFDEELLEKIFLVYGDICSIKNGLKASNFNVEQTENVVELIKKFFNIANSDVPVLRNEYKEMIETLKVIGKIKEEKDNTNSST